MKTPIKDAERHIRDTYSFFITDNEGNRLHVLPVDRLPQIVKLIKTMVK